MNKTINLPSWAIGGSLDEMSLSDMVDSYGHFLSKISSAFMTIHNSKNAAAPTEDHFMLAFYMRQETERANELLHEWHSVYNGEGAGGKAGICRSGIAASKRPLINSRGGIATSVEIIHSLLMSLPDEGMNHKEHDSYVLSRIEHEIKNIQRIIRKEEENENENYSN